MATQPGPGNAADTVPADRRWETCRSAEQFSARLRRDFLDDESMRISHSDYWKPAPYLLEAAGFETRLFDAEDVKHLPGRPKTDRLDAVWLCKIAERLMIRPRFVPPNHPSAPGYPWWSATSSGSPAGP